jgi:hypothetical protein
MGETEYEIQVDNTSRAGRGVSVVALDGEEQALDGFPLVEDGKRHVVKVRLGAAH